MTGSRGAEETPSSPVEVAKGEPTDEELGALTVVLAAMLAESTAHENEDRANLSGWKSYWSTIRQPLMSGRESWGSSLR
ncbi:MAG: acyl-CoA carboxylase subunit epsilon [Propionibacterium sp.]